MKYITKRENKTGIQKAVFTVVFILFLLYSISLIYPFIWALFNSFKLREDYWVNSFNLPCSWNFDIYAKAITNFKVKGTGLIGMFFNSVILTACSTFLAVLGSSCVAYVLSKYKFKGSNIIYMCAIFIMIMPMIGTLPALYKMMAEYRLKNSIFAVSLLYGGCFGIYFMLMYGAFGSLSWAYAEAGFSDGANDFTVFFRIMLPQVRGTIFALCLICAIGVWNDYLYPYMFMDRKPTLSTGLYLFEMDTQQKGDYPLFFAGLLLATIPMLALFLCFQNIIMNNTSVGGIKG